MVRLKVKMMLREKFVCGVSVCENVWMMVCGCVVN